MGSDSESEEITILPQKQTSSIQIDAGSASSPPKITDTLESEALIHEILTTAKTTRTFACPCGYSCDRLCALKPHIKTHKNKNEVLRRNPLSGSLEWLDLTSGDPVLQSNSGIIRGFACNFPGCIQTYAKSHYLKRHVDRIHLGKKLFCEKCQREFARSDALFRHTSGKCKAVGP